LALQGKKKTRGTSLRVPRQRRQSQNCHWGPKLPQMQNLGGRFVIFLGGQNRNFVKVRGLKLQLSKKYNLICRVMQNLWGRFVVFFLPIFEILVGKIIFFSSKSETLCNLIGVHYIVVCL